MKSQKEASLDEKILSITQGKAHTCAELLIQDAEIQAFQEYANTVSIRRLTYNDHGPVHMRKVTINACIMLKLLHSAGIQTSLEKEELGTFEDSLIGVMLAAFLHDIGMCSGRQNHEHTSAIFAYPILIRLLGALYPDDLNKQIALRALAVEGIQGHMATQKIHSLEAGIILVADGCDMEKGRARIPMMISREPRMGDIHQYSASAIDRVHIEAGDKRPIGIKIYMKESVGFFQIEEVLLQKIAMSPVKDYIELDAFAPDQEVKRYLG